MLSSLLAMIRLLFYTSLSPLTTGNSLLLLTMDLRKIKNLQFLTMLSMELLAFSIRMYSVRILVFPRTQNIRTTSTARRPKLKIVTKSTS